MGTDHDLSAENARYQRQILLPQLGARGQRKLRSARVLVVGAGGLGTPVIQYLSAAGIGTIGIIDDDVVEESNLHRQVIHGLTTIGMPKVDSALQSVRDLAGDLVNVEPLNFRLTPENAADVFSAYDVIVDGADNFPTRYLVSDTASRLGKPVVWGSILAFNAQVSVFWSDPPNGESVTLRDLFPEAPRPGEVLSCGEAGVLGALCGQAGSVMAMEVIKLVAQIGKPLLGRILVIDSLRSSFDQIVIRPNAALGLWDSAHYETPASAPGIQVVSKGDTQGAPAVEPVLVDVRESHEYQAGHIPGALSLPWTDFDQVQIEKLRGAPVVVYCETGIRAEMMAEEFAYAGLSNVAVLDGHFLGWAASGEEIEIGEGRSL